MDYVNEQTNFNSETLPEDLRIDLADLLSDLLSQHYNELVSETSKSIASDFPSTVVNNLSISNDLHSNLLPNLYDRVGQMRNTISKAITAARQLNGCDLDLAAQEKLLLAVATSCTAKRQLLCQLKRDLLDLPDFNKADNIFNNLYIPHYNSNDMHIT